MCLQLGGLFQVLRAKGLQCDGHTTGGRAGSAGKDVDGYGFGEQNRAGHIQHGGLRQRKAGHDFYYRTGQIHNFAVHRAQEKCRKPRDDIAGCTADIITQIGLQQVQPAQQCHQYGAKRRDLDDGMAFVSQYYQQNKP